MDPFPVGFRFARLILGKASEAETESWGRRYFLYLFWRRAADEPVSKGHKNYLSLFYFFDWNCDFKSIGNGLCKRGEGGFPTSNNVCDNGNARFSLRSRLENEF